MALSGVKVVEFAGLAPGPFAGLILADHGAEVIRIDAPTSSSDDVLCRGKKSIALNLKTTSGQAVARKLISRADVLIDPFRPGVLERLGQGPEVFLSKEETKGLNDQLIFARIVGFPRTGPHKSMAGHDINYIAISGVLSMLPGTQEKPTFPLNLLADFGGGGLMCVVGILLALFERSKSGKGQVVHADMVSGTRYLSSFPLLHVSAGSASPHFSLTRGANVLDGGAPFYDVYTCADGKWMSVGCLEPAFFTQFISIFNEALRSEGLTYPWAPTAATQRNINDWPKLRSYIRTGFESRPRAFWESIFHATDACVLPVLSPEEAKKLDSSFRCPQPHPQLSRTPSPPGRDPGAGLTLKPGTHAEEILSSLGLTAEERRALASEGALGERMRVESKL